MKKECFKLQRGVTLLSLTIYIIVLTTVLGIMAGISGLFYNNISLLQDAVENSSDFDTLNSCFIIDAKNNKAVRVDNDTKKIVFEDDTTYTYNETEKTIYRGENKVASNVQYFDVSVSTITNTVAKEILTINIIIGDSTQNLINQKIDYTLKYW